MRNTSMALALTLGIAASASAGSAKGTVTYKGTTATIAHAYLVKGPDAIEPTKTIRRIVLTTADLEPKLAACKTMGCTDGEVTEGMTIDLDAGPRLNYWVALKGQMVQYSGTAKPETLTTTADDAKHLAGTLAIDDSAAGGAKVDVQFDAPLVKELTAAR